ncbi:beta-galactosidase subunit beta [Streptococcus pneumoniae]|nr:beta-galactosidase subunit beta [Streptococcus pneumoniae]VJM57025.1 beta-galactosidase subunit beta [Streptococcus pneumoniae]VTC36192.1 beta-galactosidase subunit beta [Streptococcus pneumoniae]
MFGNCFTYLADGQAGDFFETHQKYLDIHLVLENEEAMAVTSPENVSVTQEYDEEKDIELYTGKVEQLVHLRAGECLITFPEDLHQPKVRINDEPVKKVVFKVAIS